MIHSQLAHTPKDEKANEYLAGWQRARAELNNFRKRLEQNQQDVQQKQLRTMMEPLLNLNDNFQAIVKHVPEELHENPWAQGVLHVARQLEGTLSEFNIEIVDEVGKPFDPAIHEAVEQVQAKDMTGGTVIEIVQPGYVLGSTAIRPAKVKVAA